MEIEKTPLLDCFILKPKIWNDNRGYFFENYNKNIEEFKLFLNDNYKYNLIKKTIIITNILLVKLYIKRNFSFKI